MPTLTWDGQQLIDTTTKRVRSPRQVASPWSGTGTQLVAGLLRPMESVSPAALSGSTLSGFGLGAVSDPSA